MHWKLYRKYPKKGDIVRRTYRNGSILIFKVLRNVDRYHPYWEEPVVKVKLIYSSKEYYQVGYWEGHEVNDKFYEEIFYDKDYEIQYYQCHDEKITEEEVMLELL